MSTHWTVRCFFNLHSLWLKCLLSAVKFVWTLYQIDPLLVVVEQLLLVVCVIIYVTGLWPSTPTRTFFVILTTDKIHNHLDFLNSDSSTLFVILQSYYRLSRHIDRTKINFPGVSILLGWCNNTSLNNMLITGWATSKINVTLTSKQWNSTLLWSNRLMYRTSQIRTAMTSTVSHKHRQTCAHYSPTPLVQLTAQLHNTYRDYSS